MQKLTLTITIAMAALLAGCTVRSLFPLYTENDHDFDPALLGAWAEKPDDKETWTLKRAEGNAYELVWSDGDKSTVLEARLVRLGAFRFFDLYPKDHDTAFAVPAHVFVRVRLDGDTLNFGLMSPDWLAGMLDREPSRLASVRIREPGFLRSQEQIVLTAATDKLRDFVLQHANDEETFPLTSLVRRP
jgi:hypothetical protein